MKFFIHTTGCKANQWDSYAVARMLKNEGFSASSMHLADIVIINACTVTKGAERDIRRFINRCRNVNQSGKIILAGCHPQAYPTDMFGADVMLGQNEKFIAGFYLEKKGCFVNSRSELSIEKLPLATSGLQEGRTRFFFKIQDGCDNYCSYCIVPFARGAPRSRPAKEIVRFSGDLKQQGVKEMVLTGIEISAYCDPETGMNLKELLRTLERCETPDRIRLSSIDPLFIDDEFTEIVASSEKTTRSIHIPLQSGSDKILDMMGRRYTHTYVGSVINRLIEKIPDVGIGMDVIAGFPGEDEYAFEETYRFIESIDIYYLHVFPFSARPETKASLMNGKMPETVKKERVRRLRSLDALKRLEFYKRFTGAEKVIIPEGKLYRGMFMRGFTDNYIPVYIPYEKTLENKPVKVKITGVEDEMVMGETVNSDKGNE